MKSKHWLLQRKPHINISESVENANVDTNKKTFLF